jgi:hypothetical protein
MISQLSTFLTFLAVGIVLNLLRGGRWFAPHLPGHPRYYVAGATLAILYVAGYDLTVSALVVLSLLWWSIWPWGRWYTFGVLPRSTVKLPNLFERAVEALGDHFPSQKRNDFLCFLLRQAWGVLPLIVVMSLTGTGFWAFAVWPAATLSLTFAYALSWNIFRDARAIVLAEALSGSYLGFLVFATFHP